MAQQCGSCGREVADQAQLCTLCTRNVSRDLRALPTLAGELEVTMSRQDQLSAPASDGGRSSETPLVWKPPAGDALRLLRDMLRRWVEQFAGVDPSVSDVTIPQLCIWLHNQMTVIRQHDAAGQFAVACRDAVRAANRVIDKPPDLLYVGPCGLEDADEAVCDEELYARRDADTVTCPRCAAEHSTHQRRALLLARVEDQLVTYSEACTALPGLMSEPLKVSTIKSWVHRDELTIKGYLSRRGPRDVVRPHREHPHDQPLVRVGDVIALVFRADPRAERAEPSTTTST